MTNTLKIEIRKSEAALAGFANALEMLESGKNIQPHFKCWL